MVDRRRRDLPMASVSSVGRRASNLETLMNRLPIGRAILREQSGSTGMAQAHQEVMNGMLRFELTLMQPGTLWIDDVRIESVMDPKKP